MDNCHTTGTFIVQTTNNEINNCSSVGAVTLSGADNSINNFRCENAITVSGNNNNLSNIHADAGLTITGDLSKFSNIDAEGPLALTNASKNSFSQMTVDSLSVSESGGDSDRNSFESIVVDTSANVNAGDDNAFIACVFGDSGGGGTLTIANGVNRTIVANCRSDIAIVNNGQFTELSANTVF